jgi:glycosyltransferase involved in cell wall biosynthesis
MTQILFVGRLDEPKDPLTMLKAINELVKNVSDIKFQIVGNGEKYNECQMYIRRHNLENIVSLLGWQTNVTQYYRSADIFLASSIYESFGLMFVEAGYFKLPVVATNVEGVPEVVENGVTGLLVPPRQPNLLASNLLRLINNEQERIEMGMNGYKRVISLFSAKLMVDKYEQIYEE